MAHLVLRTTQAVVAARQRIDELRYERLGWHCLHRQRRDSDGRQGRLATGHRWRRCRATLHRTQATQNGPLQRQPPGGAWRRDDELPRRTVTDHHAQATTAIDQQPYRRAGAGGGGGALQARDIGLRARAPGAGLLTPFAVFGALLGGDAIGGAQFRDRRRDEGRASRGRCGRQFTRGADQRLFARQGPSGLRQDQQADVDQGA